MRNRPVDRRLCVRRAQHSKCSGGTRRGIDRSGGDYARAAFEFPGHVHAVPRTIVSYPGAYKPGTIIVKTGSVVSIWLLGDGQAMKYGIGVGPRGFTWSGATTITAKREWPDWTPPDEMLKRRPDLPRHMVGGPDNPLGARAMYLGDTEYRIHGSNEPQHDRTATSSGCIRLTNDDVIDLTTVPRSARP